MDKSVKVKGKEIKDVRDEIFKNPFYFNLMKSFFITVA